MDFLKEHKDFINGKISYRFLCLSDVEYFVEQINKYVYSSSVLNVKDIANTIYVYCVAENQGVKFYMEGGYFGGGDCDNTKPYQRNIYEVSLI